MTWALRIEHQPEGLRLRFPEPLSTLDMTSETAAHLGSLLAVEARHRMAGVVCALENTAVSYAPSGAAHIVRAENKPNALTNYCAAAAENKPKRGGELVSFRPTLAHPLCCDCEPCLNGDGK